jgi:pimeloyl-ACP methyl ester carboxylesterase
VLTSAALAHSDPERFLAEVRAESPLWPEQEIQNELLGHQEVEAEPVAEAIRHFRFDLLELLERAQAPLLLVVGAEERDSRLTGETRREALSRFPASEHDAGHVVHRDDYDGYLRTVTAFLDSAN